MATTTTNLGLTKPAGTDAVDIAVINANMDLIDSRTVVSHVTGQELGFVPKIEGTLPNGNSYIQLMNNVPTRMGYIGYGGEGSPLSITDEANQGILLNSPSGNIKVNGNSISFSYYVGSIVANNAGDVVNRLIEMFVNFNIGAHSYYGIWDGHWYFGGTIIKHSATIGIITFFPSTLSSTQASMKIFNSGGGWNSTSI